MSKTVMILADCAPCYLTDARMHWEDFKHAIKHCALTWNFRGWLNTVVYGGKVFKLLQAEGLKVKIEDGQEPVVFGEGKEDEFAVDPKLLAIMGYSVQDFEYFQSTTQFVDVLSKKMEDSRFSNARQKLWSWMVKSLHGPKAASGPYYYLIDEVVQYDVAGLYAELTRVIDQPTIVSQAVDLDAVFSAQCRSSQDVFSYLTELRKRVKKVHSMNSSLPEACRIVIPEAFIRARLIQCISQIPVYKPFLDSLMLKKPEVWGLLSVDDLYRNLETISMNNRDVGRSPQAPNDFVQAHFVDAKKNNNNKKPNVCFKFQKTGECTKKDCRFSHEKPNGEAKPTSTTTQSSSSNSQTSSQEKKEGPPVQCAKCGDRHPTNKCKWKRACSYCGEDGHKEIVCKDKKSGKPRAMVAETEDGKPLDALCVFVDDPDSTIANVVLVDEGMGVNLALASVVEESGGYFGNLCR